MFLVSAMSVFQILVFIMQACQVVHFFKSGTETGRKDNEVCVDDIFIWKYHCFCPILMIRPMKTRKLWWTGRKGAGKNLTMFKS